MSKPNAYGTDIFTNFNNFYQDFIDQLNNFGYSIIDEDINWYMYIKKSDNKYFNE